MMSKITSDKVDEPLQQLTDVEEEDRYISGDPQARAALCLSGGGIRSATFGLGVLQALAANGLLDRFHYLSTVSGGGYIGAWFTAWCRRERGGNPVGVAGVQEELRKILSGDEPLEIAHLRRYSNYLAPGAGLLSADRWGVVATYLRNLVLTWCLFLPPLFLLLLLPRVLLRLYALDPVGRSHLIAGAIVGTTLAVWVVGFLASQRLVAPGRNTNRSGRTLTGRFGDRAFVIGCLLPLLGAEVAFSLVWYWGQYSESGVPFLKRDYRHEAFFSNLFLWGLCGAAALFGILGWIAGSLVPPLARSQVRDNRGRFVKELIFVALVAPFGAFLSYWAATRILPEPTSDVLLYVLTVIPTGLIFFLVSSTILIALNSKIGMTEFEREWFARAGGWLLIAGALWVGLCAVVYYGAALILTLVKGDYSQYAVLLGGIAATLIAVVGGYSTATPGTRERQAGASVTERAALSMPIANVSKGFRPALGRSRTALVTAAASLTFVMLAILITLALNGVIRVSHDEQWQPGKILLTSTTAAGHCEGRPSGGSERPRAASGTDAQTLRTALGEAIVRECLDLVKPTLPGYFSLGILTSAIVVIAGISISVNTFSLNGLYRNRLMRAYLAASNEHTDPDRFSGFDPRDNIFLRNCWPEPAATVGVSTPQPPIPPSGVWQGRPETPAQVTTSSTDLLFHVINTAVNISPDTWRRQAHESDTPRAQRYERMAASFTFTPLRAGSPVLGYRDIRDYGNTDQAGITLATAMAISGAAVSPNMGYHSSGAVRLLLTLFNVRLGGWIGNPQPDNHPLRYDPLFSLRPIISEAFGLLKRRSPYVYLSDGGHFDNLGLYEMVRRRCRLIVVSDASADPAFTYDSLADAIRRIRLDEGVEITLYDPLERAEEPNAHFGHVAVGRIHYDPCGNASKDGLLLYLKPRMHKGEPLDIQGYKRKSPAFPHQTTTDQFYSEEQFESYRALGYHIATAALQELHISETLRSQYTVDCTLAQQLCHKHPRCADPQWWGEACNLLTAFVSPAGQGDNDVSQRHTTREQDVQTPESGKEASQLQQPETGDLDAPAPM